MTDDLEHIEDANRPDNYALVTIADENIIKQDVGALTGHRRTLGYPDHHESLYASESDRIVETGKRVTDLFVQKNVQIGKSGKP